MSERLLVEVAPVERLPHAVAALGLKHPLVIGLPPGGLLVAGRVARLLEAPLDMLLPRHDEQPIRFADAVTWPALAGRSAVLVDDGCADPLAIHAALAWLRRMRPDCLVVAVPELHPCLVRALATEYDHLFRRVPGLETGPQPPATRVVPPAVAAEADAWRRIA